LGRERFRSFLAAAAPRSSGGRLLALEAGMDALLEDAHRLMELNPNLHDLSKSLEAGLISFANRDLLFPWCSLLKGRLLRESPLRPAKATVVHGAMQKLTDSERKRHAAAEQIYQSYVQTFPSIAKLHRLATGQLDRLLEFPLSRNVAR
jgi:hypothetical protein